MTARFLAFSLATLLAVSPSFAQETRVRSTTAGPSALEAHAARMERDAAENLKAGYPGVGWFVDIDSVYPADTAEYEAVRKSFLMVFSLFSNDRAELPLARVTVGGVQLECPDSMPRDVPLDSATARGFGKFRADTLCIVPVDVARKSKNIKLDFTKSHKNIEIPAYPFEEPDFVKADSDPRPSVTPNLTALQRFIDREYPCFGFRVSHEVPHIVCDKSLETNGPVPLHEIASGTMTHDPLSLAHFETRIEEDAKDYVVRYPGASAGRFVEFDTAMPLDPSEYEGMGKYAIVLVSAFSPKSEELPLRILRAGDLELRCVGKISRKVPDGTAAAKFFGINRVDAFYIVPVAALKRGALLTADFARNRSNFTVGNLDAREAPDFIKNDQNDAPTHAPIVTTLKTMIEREYPGFGIEAAP